MTLPDSTTACLLSMILYLMREAQPISIIYAMHNGMRGCSVRTQCLGLRFTVLHRVQPDGRSTGEGLRDLIMGLIAGVPPDEYDAELQRLAERSMTGYDECLALIRDPDTRAHASSIVAESSFDVDLDSEDDDEDDDSQVVDDAFVRSLERVSGETKPTRCGRCGMDTAETAFGECERCIDACEEDPEWRCDCLFCMAVRETALVWERWHPSDEFGQAIKAATDKAFDQLVDHPEDYLQQ